MEGRSAGNPRVERGGTASEAIAAGGRANYLLPDQGVVLTAGAVQTLRIRAHRQLRRYSTYT